MAGNGPVITPPVTTTPADAAAHNAEVAAKLAAQDIMGQSSAPEFNSDTGDTLDKLAAQVRPDPEAAKAAEEAAAAKAAEEAAAKAAAQQQKEEDQLKLAHAEGLDTFQRAFAACMDARNYSVK